MITFYAKRMIHDDHFSYLIYNILHYIHDIESTVPFKALIRKQKLTDEVIDHKVRGMSNYNPKCVPRKKVEVGYRFHTNLVQNDLKSFFDQSGNASASTLFFCANSSARSR